MKFKALIIMLAAIIFVSCSDEKMDETPQQMEQSTTASNAHKVTVEEILQANEYTYLRVDEEGNQDWIAIAKRTDIEEGETIYYTDAMEMKNFHSKDLDKDFESVWFVQAVSKKPFMAQQSMEGASPHSNVKPKADESISIEPVEGGITIAELFDNRSSYDGETVKIKGKVVKINRGIMGRNWLHIQDGTGEGGNYDLTVTTKENSQLGQIVVVQGYVTLDKDFGSGYKYDIILENSEIIPETNM